VALRKEEWALRSGYIKELKRRRAIELKELPCASGILVVAESHRAVGIACKKPGILLPWTRNDRRIRAGSLFVPGWRCIRSPESLDFFDRLAEVTGIPNRWIQMPNCKLLHCYLHVDNLLALKRMQGHIIDEEGKGYQDEQAKLSIGLAELERLNFALPDRLKEDDRKTLAQALAYVEALFENCFRAEKLSLSEFARNLRQRIATIYRRFQFEESLMARVEAIKRRQDEIGQISPFFAARKKGAEEEIKRYQRKLNSASQMIAFYLKQSTQAEINQQAKTVRSALQNLAENLRQDILARPARTPARQAAVRMRKAANCWEKTDNWGSRRKETISSLKAAQTFLTSAQESLEP
jgi:hypothetical protein